LREHHREHTIGRLAACADRPLALELVEEDDEKQA